MSSTSDGYKALNKLLEKEKLPLWITSTEQQWERIAPYMESTEYQWKEEFRLRQAIDSQSAETYWRSYLKRPPTTTPASLMLEANVKGIVVWNVIPRIINNAGD